MSIPQKDQGRVGAIDDTVRITSLDIVDTHPGDESPHVAILLCTRNGARFLEQQLDSIYAQEHKNFSLWVSDDGSEDTTSQILQQNQAYPEEARFVVKKGPRQGFVKNFHSLICAPEISTNYYAYADQDDVWQPNKLSCAIAKLGKIPGHVPALYCSRTRLIDENEIVLGLSPLFPKPTVFANALVQNVGGGNTMVMNKAARDLLCKAGNVDVVSHDWWAYQLISGAGGSIIYDSYPSVNYRQHDDNMVGSNNDWPSRLYRLGLLLKGRFRSWNTRNTQALQEVQYLLTPENRNILNEFCTARNRWLIPRIRGTIRSGIYRQTLLGNLGLIAAVILKKL